jgi:hypothetical protein
LREVAFEEGADEAGAPFEALGVGAGAVGAGEAAAEPEAGELVGAGFVKAERVEFVIDDAAGKGFSAALEEFRGGGAEEEEPGGIAGTVGEDAEGVEDVGEALDFVDDDEAAEITEAEERVLDAGEVGGAFKVEDAAAYGGGGVEGAGEGGFADLAGSDDGDDAVPGEEAAEVEELGFAAKHD